MSRDQRPIRDLGDQLSTFAIDQHMPVAGSDEGLAVLQPISILRLFDSYGALLVEPLREGFGKYFRHMLHNHDRRTVGRQSGKKDTKSLGSTCRSANRNYSVRGD